MTKKGKKETSKNKLTKHKHYANKKPSITAPIPRMVMIRSEPTNEGPSAEERL